MFDRVQSMLVKELLQLKRDRWALIRLFVPLVVQVIVYGYAATFTVNHVATALLDLDRSDASRDLVSHFVATGRFDIVDVAASDDAIRRDIDGGRAQFAIVIHAGFSQFLGAYNFV